MTIWILAGLVLVVGALAAFVLLEHADLFQRHRALAHRVQLLERARYDFTRPHDHIEAFGYSGPWPVPGVWMPDIIPADLLSLSCKLSQSLKQAAGAVDGDPTFRVDKDAGHAGADGVLGRRAVQAPHDHSFACLEPGPYMNHFRIRRFQKNPATGLPAPPRHSAVTGCADGGDSDRNDADVDHSDAEPADRPIAKAVGVVADDAAVLGDAGRALGCPDHRDTQPHTVAPQGPDRVDHPEHGAQDSDRERYSRHPVHASSLSSSPQQAYVEVQ